MAAPFPDHVSERLLRLGICDEDLEERFDRASGPGGQNVNKVATSVWLRHHPTGLTVRSESSRSQQANRVEARLRLCDKLELEQKKKKQQRAIQRRKKRLAAQGRPRKVKEKILKSKRQRAETKRNRRYRPGE